MKKITIIAFALIALLTSCDDDTRGRIDTDTQPKVDIDYKVTFLFEVDGIKVYRFVDNGERIYFTSANGKTQYDYTTTQVTGKTTRTTHHHVESMNVNQQ